MRYYEIYDFNFYEILDLNSNMTLRLLQPGGITHIGQLTVNSVKPDLKIVSIWISKVKAVVKHNN
jgi:hypothetical protein